MMKSFVLGEVRPPTDEDFEYFKWVAVDQSQWKKHHGKKHVCVYTRSTEVSNFKMIKVTAEISDLSADVLYDTLHDPDYRAIWDKTMRESSEICTVAHNSRIEYHAIKAPFAFANRDFVLNRVWRINGNEYIIFNRSVFHKKMPPRKEYIRALTYLTGYLIVKTGPNTCNFVYVTQNDPRGDIPVWAINLGTKSLVPGLMKALHQAALRYPAWKEQHEPHFKPWRFAEQHDNNCPLLDMNDILNQPDLPKTRIDETNVNESAALHEVEDEDLSDSE
ncbi:unnamed protein product [Dicrocoelium dendriticum]|nr:unnamed protein product [Dicrocoelium dendriticum]